MRNSKIIDRLRKTLQAAGPYGNASVDQFQENYFQNGELKNADSARSAIVEFIDERECSKTKDSPDPDDKHESQ